MSDKSVWITSDRASHVRAGPRARKGLWAGARTVMMLVWLAGLFLSPMPPAQAAWVSGFDDVVADDGVCTLREAITAANTNTASGSTPGECSAGSTAHDLVSLGPGTYTLSIGGAREDDNASGDLDIKERMTISGAGADRTIIDGSDLDRVIHNHYGVILILEDLTIRNGTSPRGADSIGYGASRGSPGGGIYNYGGELTLRRCKVLNNVAGSGGTGDGDYGGAGGPGGGIASEDGPLTLEDTTVAYNWSGHGGSDIGYSGDGGQGGGGGGIYATGDTVIVRSSVHHNHTGTGGNNGTSGGSAGHGGFGGGIYASDVIDILNSTISRNVAGNGYGGVEASGGMGGGICNAGTLTLQHVTLVDNETGDGYTAGGGGGLYSTWKGVNSAQNTVIANNRLGVAAGGATPSGPDCYTYSSSLASAGYNLIETTAGCSITGDATGNVYGTDPALTSLADNGGATLTHGFSPSSPVADHIGAGTSGCGSIFTVDQRWQPRPAGAGCDIGAVEMQASETVAEVAGLAEGETAALSSVLAAVTRNVGSGDPMTITLSRRDEPPSAAAGTTDGYRTIPAQWHITASGDTYNVDLGLCYTDDEATGLDETALDIYRWDAYEGVWVDRNGVLDTANNCITATGVTALSTWMLGAIPTPIYVDVDATGNDDGTSWANAYNDLQDALGAAVYGDEVWVAEGTYKPTDGTDRSVAFTMVPGVGLYGGFAGIEMDRSERDWSTNVVTLSGDIGTIGSNGDNSYHVVVGSGVTETAALDGFLVVGGNADGSDPDDRGGGVYISAGDPLVRNCTLAGNRAYFYGGGMAVGNSGAPTIAETTFINNSVTYYGGGMASLGSSSPWIANARFLGNTTGGSGSGGGALILQASPVYVNTLFSGNTCGNVGGGVYNWSGTPEFRSVTFARNHASNRGGGMSNATSSLTVVNGVFWGNTATVSNAQIDPAGLASAVTYSLVDGGYTGTGNLSADPVFADADGPDDIAGTLDDDLRLNAGSPAIDAGSNSAVPADVADLDADGDIGEPLPLDLDQNPRFTDGPEPDTGEGTPPLVDMGAYEKQRSCWVRLNDDATDYTSVQDAVDASAASSDVVKVAGMCGGVSVRDGLTQTLMITKTLTVRGGYTQTFAGPPDPVAYPTTLSAGGRGRVLVIDGSISPSIDGLRITGGDAAGQGGGGPDDGGGGVAVFDASATISNCWVFGNEATVGGGVLISGPSSLVNSEVYDNVADEGGGVATGYCEPTIVGSYIHHNRATSDGGGLHLYATGGTITGTTVAHNEAGQAGGLYLRESDTAIRETDILSNTADGDGGGILIDNSAATLTGSSILSNCAATGSGGGVKLEGEGSDNAVVHDNEIAWNEATWVGAGIFLNDSHSTVTDNEIHHNTGNEGSGTTVQDSSPTIRGNTIAHNSASWRAGALAYYSGRGVLSANVVRDNSAQWDAGAVRFEESAPALVNNAFIDNELTGGGKGAIHLVTSTVTLVHNTIVDNSGGDGYGVYLGSAGSAVTLTNSIVATQTTGVMVDGGSAALVQGVLWYGNGDNTDGGGTITVLDEHSGVPAFAADGYHLMEGSAAVDAGTATGVTVDIDGDPRPQGDDADIGADEWLVTDYLVFLPLVLRAGP